MVPIAPSSSAILHRSFAKLYHTASSGEGCNIITQDGIKILDGCSGAAVSCLGHGHEAVIDAMVAQTRRMAFAHTSAFTSDPAETLASLLKNTSEGQFSKVMFLSSGSEAIESALKVARQYHLANHNPDRSIFISREFSYHGNTLGALSAGCSDTRRKAFEPMLSNAFRYVSACFFSRDALPEESEATYVDRLIVEYEQMIKSVGSERVAAIIIETVPGITLGSILPARGYLARLRELCDRHGCLLIFDEVMCGMGRIGTLHAWQSLGGVPPDIQTIGKGLGGGYQPISAVLLSPRIVGVLSNASATHPFVTGHTYQGHAIGCAAALAVQRTIVKDNLLANVQQMGKRLHSRLELATPMLKEVRGLGLFQTVEFKTGPGNAIAGAVAAKCFENGLAVYLCSTAVDAILFAPPYIITEEEIDSLVDIFVASVTEVLEAG